jgi:hypothetical protein
MNDHTLRVAIGNTKSSLKNIENGVQGAVMSVTLFLVAMANICEKIEKPTKILGYSDDWVLNTSRRTAKMAENELQQSTIKIATANETGFTISAEKTKMLLVQRKRPRVQSRSSLKICMGERMLEMIRQHRILGLIFDEKLYWNEYLKNARASKKLNLPKTLSH